MNYQNKLRRTTACKYLKVELCSIHCEPELCHIKSEAVLRVKHVEVLLLSLNVSPESVPLSTHCQLPENVTFSLQFCRQKQQSALNFNGVEKAERVTTHTLQKRGLEGGISLTLLFYIKFRSLS